MQIRQLQIENFRGIRNLKWFLNGRIVCLIGPNDSTKTTILDAIEFALSPRSNIQVTDADFHNSDIDKPIIINVTVTEFPKELIVEPDKFGLFVRGIHPTNGLVDDPDENSELALTLRLMIDKTLEPTWEIVKDSQGEPKRIGWQDRERLGLTRLGEDVDRHLTWARGSALSKMTGKGASASQTFLEVTRKAKQVVAGAKMPELEEAATATLDAARYLGAEFKELKPGLDGGGLSLGSSILGLHEANVPMRLWGLGTKRLVALGIQQSGVGQISILLLDEIEHGLEPHRIRHLISRLTNGKDDKPRVQGQVIFTTHSPTAVVALTATDLHFVRSKAGETTVSQVQERYVEAFQSVARTQPLALLGRKVLSCEGATEVGLLRGLTPYLTKLKGQHPVNLGFVAIDGKGRTVAPSVSLELKRVGYDTALFADTDEPIEPDKNVLEKAGVPTFLWDGKMSTEQRLMADLPVESIQEVLDAAFEELGADVVVSHVSEFSSKNLAAWDKSFTGWLKSGLNEGQLRAAIGTAAKKGKVGGKSAGWFKNVTMEFGSVRLSPLRCQNLKASQPKNSFLHWQRGFMADDLAKTLAQEKHALVIAPAGCGKTHLISEATGYCTGRQLVLTHTHAGVKAMRDRMAQLEVPPEKYRIATLDAFALRYATAFPSLSGWNMLTPKGEEWQILRPAACKVLGFRVAHEILHASYAGVFVDEYQDCSKGQHAMVQALAAILPCRVLGDPLQSVFAQVNKSHALPWQTVEKTFPFLGELTTPYRWVGKNVSLGKWLLEVRSILLKGGEIDLRSVGCISFIECDPARRALAECLEKMNVGKESVVGLFQRREQCHLLAGNLQNRYVVFEDGHAEDLMAWAEKIDAASGPKRVKAVADFARRWLTRIPSLADSVVQRATDSKPTRAKRADLRHLASTLEAIRDSHDTKLIVSVLDAYLALEEKPMFKSREIYSGLRQAAQEGAGTSKTPLHEASWRHRDNLRRNGRKPWSKCLATPLLVKGLEFDHALILNSADFPDAEGLYVSLTRASRSLTILGKSPVLTVKRMS